MRDTAITPGVAGLVRSLRANASTTALLFDIDGVLSPIVPNANDARVPGEVLDLLAALVGRYAVVGVVSGRGLGGATGVDALVPVPGLARAGNHGMEIADPGGEPQVVPAAQPHLTAMRAFVDGHPRDEMARHGAWLEDKGASASLHFRESNAPDMAEAYLEGEVAQHARDLGLKVRRGRMIVEILPDVQVDKGTAVAGIVRGTGVRTALYVGDDRTDMDAWRGLRELVAAGELDAAHCVLADQPEVGADVRAAADIAVAGTDGVRDLLAALAA